MKPRSIDVLDDLIATCPESFNPWSLEPLKTVAFLDPLIRYEDGDEMDCKFNPPVSFPNLDLPVIRFDTEIMRDLETGHIDSDPNCISYSCPAELIRRQEKKSMQQKEDQQKESTLLTSICNRLVHRFPADQRFSKSWISNGTMPVDADTVMNDFLSMSNHETVDAFTFKPSPKSTAEQQIDINESGRLKGIDKDTLIRLEQRMHNSNKEIISYSVMVMLAPY